MGWDDAFFARSTVEELLSSEDPGDHALMSDIPSVLVTRALKRAGGSMFVSARASSQTQTDPSFRPLRISVVRDGKTRVSVPVSFSA